MLEVYEFGYNFWEQLFMVLVLSGFLMGGTIILWFFFKALFLGARKIWPIIIKKTSLNL